MLYLKALVPRLQSWWRSAPTAAPLMACPLCIVPAAAVATSAGTALGLDANDWKVQSGTPTLAGLACFGAIRMKNGAWRMSGCKRVKLAAACGVGLLALGGVRFITAA